MIKILAFLFTGCWQYVGTFKLTGYGGGVGSRVIHKCTKCCKHKKQDLI